MVLDLGHAKTDEKKALLSKTTISLFSSLPGQKERDANEREHLKPLPNGLCTPYLIP